MVRLLNPMTLYNEMLVDVSCIYNALHDYTIWDTN
jgi:hypothetical protein